MSTRPFSTSSLCPPAATTTRTLSDLADTIFSPPASCLDATYKQSPYGYDTIDKYTDSSVFSVSGSQGYVTYTTTYVANYVVKGRDPSCFPRSFPTTTCLYETVIASTTGYSVSEQSYIYSPGRCPESYITASSSIDKANTDITHAICCPVNYATYDFDYTGAAECWKAAESSVTYLQGSSIYRFWADQLYAPTIQIAWQKTDLARWAGGPVTTTPTLSTPTPPVTTSATSAPAGLSTGAKAGIGVGAAAGGLLVIAAIVFLVLRRRRKTRDISQGSHQDVVAGSQQAERFNDGKRHSEMTSVQGYPSPSPAYQSPPQEYHSPPQEFYSPPQEYQSTSKQETYKHVAAGSDPAELESGWRGWEAPTGNSIGTNAGDQIHAQGPPGSQSPSAVSPVIR